MSDVNNVVVSGWVNEKSINFRKKSETSASLIFSITSMERRYNGATEKWEDYPNFFNIKIFGKYAITMEKMMKKGTKITVTGRLSNDRWTNNDGESRSQVSITAKELEITRFPARDESSNSSSETHSYAEDENYLNSLEKEDGAGAASGTSTLPDEGEIDIVDEGDIPNWV